MKSTQKHPNCKKGVAHAKKGSMKKLEIKGGSGCGGLMMAKFLIATIQMNFGADSQLEEATQICLNRCY